MLKWFIRNEWREMKRSSMWEQSLAIKIGVGFLFFILFFEFAVGSIYFSDKLEEIFPDDDPVEKFNSFVLYGFSLGFLTRFFMQKVPVLSIQPYLHLPIKKSSLVNFVLGKSLLSFFNFIPIVIITPFVIFQLAPYSDYSSSGVWAYVLSMVFMVLSVNFLSIYFKRSLSVNSWISGVIALFIIVLGILDYYGIVSAGKFSASVFTLVLSQPVLLLLPLILAMVAYLANYRTLISKLYPEENRKAKKGVAVQEIKYLKQFGEIGQLMQLEIKLFLRNKRPKSTLIFIPIFLLYGFMFYPQKIYLEMSGMLIFVGLFMTGPILMMYGQYILSWESSYFDGILTSIGDFNRYFRAKYYIMAGTTVAAFIVTLPYVYYGTQILMINLACALFNIGISPFIVLFLSSNNKKRLDLSQGSAFNYQGVSGTQFILSIPIFVVPLLIYLPFWAFGNPEAGIAAIGITGLAGIGFNKVLMNVVVQRFERRKYIIADGFRNKN
jgi:hypothetical protein